MASAFQTVFTYQGSPARVVFGAGTLAQAGAEVERMGGKRALVLTTPEQAATGQALCAQLGTLAVGQFSGAVMHTPVSVTQTAFNEITRTGADVVVAIGGGSTIGLAKALALRTGLPQIAIPTTFAGSEATPILGQTQDGEKTTMTDPRLRPAVIVYDVALVKTMPPALAISSGLNALAHAVEGLYAQDRNPMTSLMALEGIRAMISALPRLKSDSADLQAWAEAQYGAWLCGTVLGQVGMSIHHKLCHALGGGFDLPHADTHAILLPHAVSHVEPAVPELLAPVAELMGTRTAALGLQALAKSLGAPMRLLDLGLTETDLDRAVSLATERPYWSPRPIDRQTMMPLLRRALTGAPAQS
ncbi:maleylacetate reductase [Devosia psychrophila]|uniref:Maleylacetate reductase n=1 Tax=Devosia psychrophila TaxID=728005 RepID=A0A0F5Q013_9HYPH|nr:maleylacetate reductase [Devosia psychrophila]KKC34228.1 Maleylacetate reductase [Devosia psychrophila]SFD27035.1 maleylacetate reductase [Devosia psychrophila]